MQPTDQAAIDEDVELFEVPPSRRPFSAGDVVRLLLGLVLVVGGVLVAWLGRSTVRGIESDLLRAFARLPDGFEELLLGVAQLVTSVVPTVAAIVLLTRHRWREALLLFATGVLATLAMLLVRPLLVDQDLRALLEELSANPSFTGSAYPDSTVVASTTAIVTVAAPWLSRRWKRALWGGVATLVVLRLLVVSQPSFDLVLALGVGTVVGSAVLLVFGSPNTEPRPEELLAGLREAGFDPRRIERTGWHGTVSGYRFLDRGGTSYDVSLRTPDERDADLLDRLYRGIRFRSSEVGVAYATLKRRIEHEALVLTLAERGSVRAPEALRIGTTSGGSAFLVTAAHQARPLTAEDLADDRILDALWDQVRRLHAAGIAHRQLGLESLYVDGQDVWLDEFDRAQTAPHERERARDVAQLLTETAVVVGATRAVEAAVRGMGAEAVASCLRMLQPLALPPGTKARAAERPGLVDELRTEVVEATGAPSVELEELERIKPRTLLVIAASTFAFYTLLPQLANLSATVDAFGNAELVWIVGALLASAASYVLAAVSLQGAVADPVPFGPNVRAQVASSFAGLVGPAGAGGFALTGRFLQRAGVQPAEAGASVAVRAVAGFAVHLTLLGGFVLWSGRSGLRGFSIPDSSTLLLVATVVLVVIGLVLALGPVRRRVVSPVISSLRTGLRQIGRVFRNPARVGALAGGSVGVSLLYVTAVACSIEAFGGGLRFSQIGAAYLGAMAVAAIAPTPGGLGAVESAMIAALTGFGLDEGIAVSATLAFRLATFWLPLLPGWLAMRWMERNDEL